MRVVETDNFCGDYPYEQWACPYSLSKHKADAIANLFNELMCDSQDSPRWWKVVDDDYQLQPGFEP